MIDLHCHLLAGLDDGPSSTDLSVAMARAFLAEGVDTVAATPHVNAHFANDAERIAAAAAQVREALALADVPLHIARGAEVDLHTALQMDDPALRSLALGDGPWLLIEMPHHVNPRLLVAVQELLVRDHRVLLAHPERSPSLARDPKSLRQLVDDGARVQITATSLTGRFGRSAAACARTLLRSGLVHAVASDAHDLERRPPGVLAALQASDASEELVRWVTEEAPRLILDGEQVPALAPSAKRTRSPLRALTSRLRSDARG